MPSLQLELEGLFSAVLAKGSSDLYLVVGQRPTMRIRGDLLLVEEFPVLTAEHVVDLLSLMITPEQREQLDMTRELEFAYNYKENARFRVNAYYQKGIVSVAMRYIPRQIRPLSQLGLPDGIADFAMAQKGLVIFAGPTGSGKSTTMAALLNQINHTRSVRIFTLEQPIEYLFQHDRSTVEQREVGRDTASFGQALAAALRQSPDVIAVSEVLTAADFEAVLTLVETGHLVFVAVPSSFATPTIEWLTNLFPPLRADEIHGRIAGTLLGIVTQRLVPAIDGTQAPAVELMTADETVRGLVRKGQLFQLDDVIMTRVSEGMMAFDRSLAMLVRDSRITKEEAANQAQDLASLETLLNQ